MVVAASVVGAVAMWFVLGKASGGGDLSAHEQRITKTSRSGGVKKITEISLSRKDGKKSVRIVESESARPNVLELTKSAGGAGEDDDLTDVEKSVLKEIQAALDANDLKSLRRALSRLTASTKSGGLGGYANVSRSVRAAAVQALGWFGKDAAIDLMGFMADGDDEIAADAASQFELALQDVDLGDRERAEIVKATAKTLTDPDQLDTLLFQLIDMRPSVKVDTVISIMTEGTPQAKATMRDQIEFYLDVDVTTVDDAKKWAAQNPDDPDDDNFYGGSRR